ncbi:MAG: ABC transporter permease subunit [Treponema sp.]|jgi:putative spermidine/putrescine transport system permease protein|nr:ABC transporter permease subunit [Treponema sp.]
MKRFAPYLLVLPFVLIICFIFIGGLFQAVVQSLGYMPVFGFNEITFDFYRQVFNDWRFLNSIRNTFYIAFVSSLISVIMGTLIAIIMSKLIPAPKLSYLFYKTPILLPHLIVIVMMFFIFSQTGIISRFAFSLGLINNPNDFPLLVFDRLSIGIILVYLFKQIPFVSLTVFTVLKNIDKKHSQVAENLGSSSWHTLTKITLPLLAPSIFSVFLICFAFGFGAFEVPFLLGSPATVTLPVLAYFEHRSPTLVTNLTGMVINVIISVISLTLAFIYAIVFKVFNRHGLKGGLL